MMTTTDFLKYYETISDTDLLLILDNKKDYQQSAIEAAQQELNKRCLTQEQVSAARQVILDRSKKKSRKSENVLVLTNNIKATTDDVLDTLHPISDRRQSFKTKLILIVLVFSFISVYQIGSNYEWLELYIRGFFEHPGTSLVVVLPPIVLPIGVLFFALRRKIGWILFAAFLTYSTVWSLRVLASSINWQGSDTESFNSLFPQPSVIVQILSVVFFLGTLFIISQADIRNQFKLTKRTAFKTFSIAWLVTFVIIFVTS